MQQFFVFWMIFCLSTSIGDGIAAAAAVTVSTVYGNIEGFEYETLNGFKSDVFLGIPFAKPPVGELRYEKPVPVEPWNTTLSATAYKSQCATFTYSSSQSEDCLYLNIMRPSTPSTDPRGYPVAVWIHGGGFITGSASLTAPYEYTVQNLVSRGMIFISTNYRLGPFGFYSNGDKNAPGNNGLWDLYEALKFVNKVIGNFGGNAKRVTIFGQSAGAACVSYLSLKPEAKKLFSQSIQMSGGFQGLWAQGDDVIASTKKLNTFLGCDTAENPKNCAKNFTLAETQTALQSFINPIPGFGSRVNDPDISFFNPRFDGEFIEAKTFEKAIKHAPKRTQMFGTNSQEIAGYSRYPANFSYYLPIPYWKFKNFTTNDFSEYVAKLYGTEEAYGNNKQDATEKIVNWYLDNAIYTHDIPLQSYGQIVSDLYFTVPQRREAKAKTKSGNDVYFYKYSYVPTAYRDPQNDGAQHSTELRNLFNFTTDPEWAAVQQTFIDLYVSFIKTGKPTTNGITWPAVNKRIVPYLDINVNTTIGQDLWPEREAFWNKMAKKYDFDWSSRMHV